MNDNFVVYLPFIMAAAGLVVGGLVGAMLARASGSKEDSGPKTDRSLFELLRIYRDQSSNDLVLAIGDQVFKKPNDLSEKSRKALANLHTDFGRWLGVEVQKPRFGGGAAQPAVIDRPPAAPEVPAVAPAMFAIVPPKPEVKPVSMNMTSALANAIVPEKPKEPQPPKSIAAQIDEIIQEKQPASPVSGRYIRIMELPNRGVVVCIDNKEYEGVGDVEDPQVKSFLRECVVEWERRASSG